MVSTDAKGPRHWAGYEIGYFQASHRGQLPPGHSLWGKIVTFFSAGGSPEPLNGLKHVSLGFDNSVLEDSQDKVAACHAELVGIKVWETITFGSCTFRCEFGSSSQRERSVHRIILR